MDGSDFVAASHAAMIVACLIGMVRMLGLSADAANGLIVPLQRTNLPRSSAVTLIILAMERTYYFLARELSPEFDLWSLHPAPAMLSAIVALAIINESHASLRRRGFRPAVLRALQLRDASILFGVWSLVAFGGRYV